MSLSANGIGIASGLVLVESFLGREEAEAEAEAGSNRSSSSATSSSTKNVFDKCSLPVVIVDACKADSHLFC